MEENMTWEGNQVFSLKHTEFRMCSGIASNAKKKNIFGVVVQKFVSQGTNCEFPVFKRNGVNH